MKSIEVPITLEDLGDLWTINDLVSMLDVDSELKEIRILTHMELLSIIEIVYTATSRQSEEEE